MRTIFGLGLFCLLVAGCGGPEGRPHIPSADGPPPLPRVARPLVQRGTGEPVPVLADGRPIELPYRGLFPFVGDLDGDGRKDLLLGTPDAGRLKVYPNVGTDAKPVLGAAFWFDERVADGRIPKG